MWEVGRVAFTWNPNPREVEAEAEAEEDQKFKVVPTYQLLKTTAKMDEPGV